MEKIIYKLESYQIIGICIEVHNYLGQGFLEVVYKDALEIEFKKLGILFQREQPYVVDYKGVILPHKFYADFVLMDKIILEVKAVSEISNEALAQTMNYLKISKNKLGLIVNFGTPSLTYRRVVL